MNSAFWPLIIILLFVSGAARADDWDDTIVAMGQCQMEFLKDSEKIGSYKTDEFLKACMNSKGYINSPGCGFERALCYEKPMKPGFFERMFGR